MEPAQLKHRFATSDSLGMKKLLITLMLVLTAAASHAAMLGESYQQACAQYGWPTNVVNANGWFTFPSTDAQHTSTYCQFHNNRLQCVIYQCSPKSYLTNPMGDMCITAGNRGFQEVSPFNGMRRFVSYDKVVVAGVKNNNIMIVGFTSWMKQYAPKSGSNHTANNKVRHHQGLAARHQEAPEPRNQETPPEVGNIWLPAS
jgi:hypothetical protein